MTASEVIRESIDFLATGASKDFDPLVYGIPTIDRPFGIAVWPLFRKAVLVVSNAILGSPWDPESFDYKYNSAVPLSTVNQVAFMVALYYAVIFGGRRVMQNVRPIRINWLFKLHNAFLTILSFSLLVLLAEQMIPIIYRHGVFYSICNPGSWTQKVVMIYYLNYLTKYYEFVDTIFLVLRKRPLTLLHTYHHGATAILCYCQLNGSTPVSYVPISLNLAVHVLMYFYYFLSACGIRPWWKAWVTRTQIIQFVIDLGFVYFATYTYFTSKLWPWMPNMGSCAGEESAAVNGCLILTSYLVLFISFYINSYLVPKAKAAAARERKNSDAQASEPKAAKKATATQPEDQAPEASPSKATRVKRRSRRT